MAQKIGIEDAKSLMHSNQLDAYGAQRAALSKVHQCRIALQVALQELGEKRRAFVLCSARVHGFRTPEEHQDVVITTVRASFKDAVRILGEDEQAVLVPFKEHMEAFRKDPLDMPYLFTDG